jgi:hypothetical protein
MLGRPINVTGFLLAVAIVPIATPALIMPEEGRVEMLPGESSAVRFLIEDVATPLFGYSLDIDAVAAPVASGTVDVDVVASSFFEARNLIVAGGAQLDPFFSVIQSDDAGGAFVNANTADLATVTLVAGVNDVLAELVFVASPNALGTFEFELGPATALSDGGGLPVPFQARSLVIDVVPEPGTALLFCGVVALLISTQRRRCSDVRVTAGGPKALA